MKYLILASLLLAAIVPAQTSYALIIVADTANSTENLGNFTGELTYNAINAGLATLAIELTNISPLANGGYLTAFVLNNPDDLIDSVVLSSSPAGFGLLGSSSFDNNINAMPFGYFDLGAGFGGSFEGGGNPNEGIGVGNSGIFTFNLTGTNLTSLDEWSFVAEKSVLPGGGAGSYREGNEFFVARFKGFNNGKSDKVPGDPDDNVIPEPASLFLLGLGLGGLAKLRKRMG